MKKKTKEKKLNEREMSNDTPRSFSDIYSVCIPTQTPSFMSSFGHKFVNKMLPAVSYVVVFFFKLLVSSQTGL